ncbi:MAG TPA: Ca2+-dependent phosphoinositide-specific phospholipase C, partial [Bryobacteraceae bacterium]|nr:Ca2+-dependent phosphoinositide-specific phospholipase C [Bryobacteraceae bacterium]
VKPLKFDKAAFNAWDREIRAVLPSGKLIVPDDVRGSYSTLEPQSLRTWPEMDKARGIPVCAG